MSEPNSKAERRVAQYANPQSKAHWHGESTAKNIARWSDRASRNSTQFSTAKPDRTAGRPEPNLDVPELHSTSRRRGR
jgi:hypothetical protein